MQACLPTWLHLLLPCSWLLPSQPGAARLAAGGGEDDFGSEVFISDGEMGAEEEEEDSDFEVESYRRGRRGATVSARSARSAGTRSQRRGGGVRSVGTRRDRRGGGSGRRGRPSQSGLRSAGGTPRFARRDSAPALRGGAAAATAMRKVLQADEETVKAAGAGIVGARVAVCRHDDDVFAKVRYMAGWRGKWVEWQPPCDDAPSQLSWTSTDCA